MIIGFEMNVLSKFIIIYIYYDQCVIPRLARSVGKDPPPPPPRLDPGVGGLFKYSLTFLLYSSSLSDFGS